jgi:uncharacterized protein YidB (DUF937 family)
MGLLDSILGGQREQSGLSAATKALLLVLAAKAVKDHLAHRQTAPDAVPATQASPAPGGILGGILGGGDQAGAQQADAQGGGLGAILGGGGLGAIVSGLGGAGVLGSLVDLFRQNGHGTAMGSWINDGPNQQIQPGQLAEALGPGPLGELEQRTGLQRQTLLQQLADELPAAVDRLTPQGRLPTEAELAASLQGRPQA